MARRTRHVSVGGEVTEASIAAKHAFVERDGALLAAREPRVEPALEPVRVSHDRGQRDGLWLQAALGPGWRRSRRLPEPPLLRCLISIEIVGFRTKERWRARMSSWRRVPQLPFSGLVPHGIGRNKN